MKYVLFTLLTTFAVISCTENDRAKKYGGTATVDLPKGTKFVSATWKDDTLWYAYRPARLGEVPEAVTLKEQSPYGLIEGSVIFNEK